MVAEVSAAVVVCGPGQPDGIQLCRGHVGRCWTPSGVYREWAARCIRGRRALTENDVREARRARGRGPSSSGPDSSGCVIAPREPGICICRYRSAQQGVRERGEQGVRTRKREEEREREGERDNRRGQRGQGEGKSPAEAEALESSPVPPPRSHPLSPCL